MSIILVQFLYISLQATGGTAAVDNKTMNKVLEGNGKSGQDWTKWKKVYEGGCTMYNVHGTWLKIV